MGSVKREIIDLLRSTGREGIDSLLSWMIEFGFFEAPCSGAYHLCKEGGLAEHSLNVCNVAMNIAELFDCVPKESVLICSLLHDLGKVGDYGKKNYVPNILKDGTQSSSKPYSTNKDLLYVAHEIKSIEIANRFIQLKEEESHAILYHNGKYTAIGKDLKETPLQMIIHFADLWCSRVVEVED